MDPRQKAIDILDAVDNGLLNARDVLHEVLINYMSADDADDFAESAYGEYLDELHNRA